MTPTDLQRLRELCEGFRGYFFWDAERADLAYVAKECTTHPRSCGCPPRTNYDGDQDCSVPIGGAGGVDECVGEPVAAMLNAVPSLIAEVERLRALLVEVCGIANEVASDAWREESRLFGSDGRLAAISKELSNV